MRNYDDHNSNETLLTFLFGVIAGAATVVLLDKDLRDKIEDTISDVKERGEEEFDKAKTKLLKTKGKVEDNLEEKLLRIQDLIDDIKSGKNS